ncbi:unnamed protein product [Cyprideis torosa]|uniref:Uncharacterized protein n=1 Tax=Cyprideis torosa TaxID=163714 RepID=A0A7R8ZIU5_9CRUS|nr:unnamed protein product [Cyprideis torosa]CAG0887025.1 unnamed protein product [Cyprideis torosa]
MQFNAKITGEELRMSHHTPHELVDAQFASENDGSLRQTQPLPENNPEEQRRRESFAREMTMTLTSPWRSPHIDDHRSDETEISTNAGLALELAREGNRKSLLTAYLLLLTLGLFGGHQFYLGRQYHGLVMLTTLGIFGIGVWVDIFLLPTHLAQANLNSASIKDIRELMQEYRTPPFSTERFCSEVIVGLWFSVLMLALVPCACEGTVWAAIPMLCPLGSACGVYIIGCIAHEMVDWGWAFAGASLALPLFSWGDIWYGLLFSALSASTAANVVGKRWKTSVQDYSVSPVFAVPLVGIVWSLILYSSTVFFRGQRILCCPIVRLDGNDSPPFPDFPIPQEQLTREIAYLRELLFGDNGSNRNFSGALAKSASPALHGTKPVSNNTVNETEPITSTSLRTKQDNKDCTNCLQKAETLRYKFSPWELTGLLGKATENVRRPTLNAFHVMRSSKKFVKSNLSNKRKNKENSKIVPCDHSASKPAHKDKSGDDAKIGPMRTEKIKVPLGWKKAYSERLEKQFVFVTVPGRVYFINTFTNETRWSAPESQAKPGSTKRLKKVRCLHLLVKHVKSRNPVSWKNTKVTRTKKEAKAFVKDPSHSSPHKKGEINPSPKNPEYEDQNSDKLALGQGSVVQLQEA